MIKNRGSVSIEASIAFPLFLFVMLFFIYIGSIYTARAVIYEGCIETSEYMAEYAYLKDSVDLDSVVLDAATAKVRFAKYADSNALLDKFIIGGKAGVSFLGSSFPDDDGFIDLKVTYYIGLDIPLFRKYRMKCTENIKQKAYIGRTAPAEETDEKADSAYVYVAENGVVYHTNRSCTYIQPDIISADLSGSIKKSYKKCRYCGGTLSSDYTGEVYITSDGECYHSSKSCSRLKRTVSRRKLSEVNLPACSKCGGTVNE